MAETPPVGGTDAAVESSVDEGMPVVATAFRLAVKNLMIVRALRDGDDYDEADLVAALVDEIAGLIVQKEDEADRLGDSIDDARDRAGLADWHHDYRHRDVPTLELRRAADERLIERLRALATDPDYLRAQLALVRQDAVADVMGSKLDAVRAGVQDDEGQDTREREGRAADLMQDLEMRWLRVIEGTASAAADPSEVAAPERSG